MKNKFVWTGAALVALLSAFALKASAQEPAAAVTAGFSYINSYEGGRGHADVRGGYIQPAANLGYGLSVFGDLAWHHGEDKNGTFSLQSYTAGLAKRITATPYGALGWSGELGTTRVAYHEGSGSGAFGTNRVQNGFTFMTAPVIALSLAPQVALTMVPAGLVYRSHGVDPYSSINADGTPRVGVYSKIGLTVFFGGTGRNYPSRGPRY